MIFYIDYIYIYIFFFNICKVKEIYSGWVGVFIGDMEEYIVFFGNDIGYFVIIVRYWFKFIFR